MAIVTSEFVLVEFLANFPGKRYREPGWRSKALDYFDGIMANAWAEVKVIPLNTIGLLYRSIERYRKCIDKTWSLTDCSSFEIMDEHDILQAATTDEDFEQAGYIRLLVKESDGSYFAGELQ